MRIRAIISALVLITFVGCTTPYQPNGAMGGYSESRLGRDRFTVRFHGNGYTSAERASDFTLLRAAELTLDAGYRYFTVLREKDTTSHQQSFNTSYNRYLGWRTTQNVIARPGQEIRIRCFADEPMSREDAFDARFLRDEMRAKYGVEPEEAVAEADDAPKHHRTISATRSNDLPEPALPARVLKAVRASVQPSDEVAIDYDADKRWIRIRFRTPAGYAPNHANRFALFQRSQMAVLEEFRHLGRPVDWVSATASYAGGRRQLMMTTRADDVARLAPRRNADPWLAVTRAQRWTAETRRWELVRP